MKFGLARLGNTLYDLAPTIYRPFYSAYKSVSDRRERALFRSWLKPGMVVLDIGANIGVYTRFFARLVGNGGKVFAFEPEKRNLMYLKASTEDLGQVEVVDAAVLDRNGALKLYVSPDLNVDHRTYDAGDDRTIVEVRAVAIDDFLPSDIRVSAIKMDIQGSELGALRGARRLLEASQRFLVIFEYWPYGILRAGDRPENVIEFLTSRGFSIRTVKGGAVPELDSAQINDYVNLVATKG